MIKASSFDQSWDVPDRVLNAQIGMSCEGIPDLVHDLRELADAIELGGLPERWAATNCPHSVQVETVKSLGQIEQQDAHVKNLLCQRLTLGRDA